MRPLPPISCKIQGIWGKISSAPYKFQFLPWSPVDLDSQRPQDYTRSQVGFAPTVDTGCGPKGLGSMAQSPRFRWDPRLMVTRVSRSYCIHFPSAQSTWPHVQLQPGPRHLGALWLDVCTRKDPCSHHPVFGCAEWAQPLRPPGPWPTSQRLPGTQHPAPSTSPSPRRLVAGSVTPCGL